MIAADGQRDDYRISSERADVDVGVVHRYLSEESYWARHISRETVERSLAHSLCFSVLRDAQMVGFARVVSDRATFAYLCDLFIAPTARGRGLSKRLMATIDAHPDLQGLRRVLLGTRDAHGLYAQFGFTALQAPHRFMERHDADVYSRG